MENEKDILTSNVEHKKTKNKSKILFILTGASLLITIIFVFLFYYWNAVEDDAYWGKNGYHGYNLARLNYEDNFISRSEFNEVEREYRNIEKTANFFEYGIFVTGGITGILLITGIVLKVKETGKFKSSIKIKKKTLKIVGIVVAAIIIIVGLFFFVQAILNNIKIKETEEKLSQINSEELKTKLIEELEKTDLNVDLTLDTMFVDTIFTEGKDELEGFTVMSIIAFKNNNVIGGIEIPCFKINSDSNGNFKNIEYVYNRPLDTNIIAQTIRNVFKDSYNIDFTITNNTKYNTTFNQYFINEGTMTTVSNDFFLAIVNRINDDDYDDYSLVEDYKEYETAKFGLNLDDNENIDNSNSSSTTNSLPISSTQDNNNTSSSTIKNGTYNKVLTSEEKEIGVISLGDINFVIENNNIMFSDNSSQLVLEGTYTIEDNKIVGTYTKATYYSYEQLDFVTQTIEDPFEFELRENNTLYDTMGYGQFLGKCLERNATYELVE